MKKLSLFIALIACTIVSFAQSANHRFGVNTGFFIQHYNGNLGNSFFKFKTTCFSGGNLNVGMYINKSFDITAGLSIGDFGYGTTPEDNDRIEALEAECPTCGEALDMDQLLARMVAVNATVKYKFANGYLLPETTKLAPYAYVGAGVNKLSDVMKRHCVTEGYHYSINSGVGLTYNLTENFNFGYNLGTGYFPFRKVYATNEELLSSVEDNPLFIELKKQKDWYLQNTLFIGFNL
ncbi:MAG: hypothetical protein RL204_2189 [Bacteroidota bacterium]|jgi:hypothetical protein